MNRKVHYFGERIHGRKVVPLDKIMEMVCIEVVLGSNLDMVVVILEVLAHNGHKNMVWMIGYMMDMDHKVVFGRLVSMVEVHVEGVVHRHLVVVVDNHNKGHHIH